MCRFLSCGGFWYLQSRVRSGEWWSFQYLLDKDEDLSDRESEARVFVLVVPDVTDVPVSLSSVVTEFSDGFFVLPYMGICGTAVLFLLQRPCPLLYSYAGRDEVRRTTSESASAL